MMHTRALQFPIIMVGTTCAQSMLKVSEEHQTLIITSQ